MNHRYGAISCLALIACGVHVDYAPLNPPPHDLHARLPAEVEVFSGEEVPHRYVEIGTIDARRQSNSSAKKDDLIAKIRDEAARHGCDAVRVAGRADIERRIGYRAACLVYTDTAASLAPPLGIDPPRADETTRDAGAL